MRGLQILCWTMGNLQVKKSENHERGRAKHAKIACNVMSTSAPGDTYIAFLTSNRKYFARKTNQWQKVWKYDTTRQERNRDKETDSLQTGKQILSGACCVSTSSCVIWYLSVPVFKVKPDSLEWEEDNSAWLDWRLTLYR